MSDQTVLCPRCETNRYSPYGVERSATDPAPPALSRVDSETYICSACGTDEAMQNYGGVELSPPSQWPVSR